MDGTRTTRALLWSGVVSGPLFVAGFLLAGVVHLPDYDLLRHPVSGLALGEHGWAQTANFLVAGTLGLAFAVGLRRALRPRPAAAPGGAAGPGRRGGAGSVWVPLMVGAYGIGLVGSGVFVTDPVSGYPPGTPDPISYTPVGVLHDLFSAPVFLGLPVAMVVMARATARWGRPGWVVYSLLTAVVFVTCFVLASLGFGQAGGWAPLGGLFQRLSLVSGLTWLSLLGLYLLGARPFTGRPPTPPPVAATTRGFED
ncbi:DUF998 domain-containing protein [Nocardiopsis lucentensis]|uniref:DUF998 domain-containing protein n=1 Tax=Nocardiopsis lucentensis TaxID=53441 RepID=UPI00034949A5|nr:DUF998 domain-containing protein [Nocardiopsis lucentensis]